MARYVALLRGINVGGKNLLRMTELKAWFDAHGFESVVTYHQHMTTRNWNTTTTLLQMMDGR